MDGWLHERGLGGGEKRLPWRLVTPKAEKVEPLEVSEEQRQKWIDAGVDFNKITPERLALGVGIFTNASHEKFINSCKNETAYEDFGDEYIFAIWSKAENEELEISFKKY